MYTKIENCDDLVKDDNGAILNVNKEALKAYKAKRQMKHRATADQVKIVQLESEVQELKSSLQQVMAALQQRGLV